MFNKYDPNSLKVDACIKAIKEMSAEAFSLTGPRTMDWERPESLMRTTSQENERLTERAKAYLDVEEAVRDKGSETQTKVVTNVAAMLVIEDRLNREERTFLSLFLVHIRTTQRTLRGLQEGGPSRRGFLRTAVAHRRSNRIRQEPCG